VVTLKAGSLIGGGEHEDANSAQVGGIFIELNSAVTLHPGSRVKGNNAFFNGGGIYNLGVSWLEAGALVCSNSAAQCAGNPTVGTGICPIPENGMCPE
jgi:hypothetical protein